MAPFQNNPHRKGYPRQRRGQNITEYMILVVGVLTVVVLAVRPGGFFTKGVSKSLNLMFSGVDKIATEKCLGTLDDVNGQWSAWSSWGPCASCTQIRTRTCTSPAPKCNGKQCVLQDGSWGLFETDTPLACYSGSWVTGACGACTGACGRPAGTCTQSVTCNGGCCDPGSQPASVIFCTKPKYPDVWSGLGFGACSTSCDAGISSQTVTCSGMCCDALIKPPTRRACTDGCCAQTLDIGLDIENGVQFTGTFGPSGPGPFSVSCPPGYAGSPTSTCTATASGSCTGNDSYVPPASCYTIGWGPVSNTCVPADCPAVTVDAGYGRTWDVPFTLQGNTATLDCSSGGWSYTGTASYDCWLGAWRNLNAGCIPNCPREDNVFIGADLYVTFPVTVSGGSVNLTCSSYDAGPNPGDKKYVGNVSRSCSIGTWSGITGTCDFKPCSTEYFMDPNGFVQGTFGASPHGTPVSQDCSTIDSRYTGNFSRTCTYGDWLNPTGGCTAKPCSDWTTNVGGVNITFSAAGHGVTQPQNCNAFDNTYTGTVSAECSFGNWINLTGGCTAFACVNPISPSNATMCAGDDTALTADTSWSVVNNGGCTSQKCEYECNFGYLKSGNNCILAVCTGSGFANAAMCSGDDTGLTANTPRTLVPGCTSGTKCEYTCNGGYVLYGGSCCQPNCTGKCGGVSDGCGGTCTASCCGNGAIDGTEQCDGTNLNGQSCSSLGWTGTGGPLQCNADCTFNQSNCCNAVNGTWGAPWTNVGSCGTYTACYQRQQGTCNGASCGGTCTGSGTQDVACGAVDGVWGSWSGWSTCPACGWNQTQTRTRTCNSPSPSCGGAECTRLDGTRTTPMFRTETQTQNCPGLLACAPTCCGRGCPQDQYGGSSPTWGSAVTNYTSDFIWSGSSTNGVSTGDTIAFYSGRNGGDTFYCGFDRTTGRWVVMSKCGGYEAWCTDVSSCKYVQIGQNDRYCRSVIRADCGRYACGGYDVRTCQNQNGGWGCFNQTITCDTSGWCGG